MTTESTHLNDLLQIYNLTALIKEPTCYQSQNRYLNIVKLLKLASQTIIN